MPWSRSIINIVLPVLVGIAVRYGISYYREYTAQVLSYTNIAAHASEFTVGGFILRWANGQLSAWPVGDDHRLHSLWHTLERKPFLKAAKGVLDGDPIQNGHYHLKERLVATTREQTIEKISQDARDGVVTLGGVLRGDELNVPYVMTFSPDADYPESKLRFAVSLETNETSVNRVLIRYGSEKDEAFFGFGQQYSVWDLKGRRVPVIISEQGVGRGLQPLTFALNALLHGVGSDWHTTYVAKPMYMTSHMRSLALENREVSIFDLIKAREVTVEVWSTSVKGIIFRGDTPVDIVRAITTETGRMQPLPEWTQRGAIIGLEGGSTQVNNITDVLLREKVPLVGAWLQDWVGTRHDWDGTRLIWNWQVNLQYYPEWQTLRSKLAGAGVKILTYMNPYLVDVEGRFPHRRNLFREAVENGYLVKNESGMPLIAQSGSIEFGTIDPTNPHTRAWLKDVIVKNMVQEAGSSGWMADFGEYLPFSAVLHDGRGHELHNVFPDYWASLQREAIEYAKAEGGGDGDELIVFVRSGYIKTPGLAQLYWVGDQLVTWDAHDGIKTVLPAMLSGGLMGHSLSHSDIGGYTMIDHWAFKFFRTRELLFRWIELGAFAGVIFRSHLGSFMNTPSAQIWDDLESIQHFSRFANIFALLAEYRKDLMVEAATHGLPVVRPLLLHFYPQDKEVLHITSQFLLGPDLLVAPVLDPGRNVMKVYIPATEGGWVHVWTSSVYGQGAEKGQWVTVQSELGYPPVFNRRASKYKEVFDSVAKA